MSIPPNKRTLAIVAGLAFVIMACVVQGPGQGELHRWWSGLGPVLPHAKFPADCSLCHVGQEWDTLTADFEFVHEAVAHGQVVREDQLPRFERVCEVAEERRIRDVVVSDDIFEFLIRNASDQVAIAFQDTLSYVVTKGDLETTEHPVFVFPFAQNGDDRSEAAEFMTKITDIIVQAIKNDRVKELARDLGCDEIRLRS